MSRKKQGKNNITLQRGAAGSFSFDFKELMDIHKCSQKEGRANYWESADYNTRLFMMFRAEILGMALSRFKWFTKNL